MKKSIITLAAIGAAFLSCSKIENPALEPEGNFQVTFNCSMADDEATKTEFNEDGTIWWANGDKILYAQYATVSGTETFKSTSYTCTKAMKSFSLSVSNFNTPDAGKESAAAYFSVFPYSAYANRVLKEGIIYPRITLPDTQKPSATNYDPNADILISQYVYGLKPADSGRYSVTLKYTRPSAIGKMTITGLPAESKLKTVSFSAKKGGKDVNLAGSQIYDLVAGDMAKLTSSSCFYKQALTLDYSESALTAGPECTAFFCCYPFTLEEGDTFTVSVTTDDSSVYTREITIPAENTLAFERSKGTRFSVNMSNADKTGEWFSVKQLPSSSFKYSTSQLYYELRTSSTALSAVHYKLVPLADYEAAVAGGTVDDLYVNMTELSATNVTSLSTKSSLNLSTASGYVPDADYIMIADATDSEKGTVKCAVKVHTEPFAFSTTKGSSAGLFAHKFFGANIASIQYIAVESSAIGTLNNTTCKQYFEDHISEAVSMSGGAINSTNVNGATGAGPYYISNHVTSNVECVDLVLATMKDGRTKFCWTTQVSK